MQAAVCGERRIGVTDDENRMHFRPSGLAAPRSGEGLEHLPPFFVAIDARRAHPVHSHRERQAANRIVRHGRPASLAEPATHPNAHRLGGLSMHCKFDCCTPAVWRLVGGLDAPELCDDCGREYSRRARRLNWAAMEPPVGKGGPAKAARQRPPVPQALSSTKELSDD